MQITRVRDRVFFTDAEGVEWQVRDAERAPNGKLRLCYPSEPRAVARYFLRVDLRGVILERRRYRFRRGDCRWFDAQHFQQQLGAAGNRVLT